MHTFQTFWYGDEISPYEAMCFRSFLDHGHAFHVYTYTPDLRVPDGVNVRDASEIISKDRYFVYETGPGRGSHAAFSNLFRYKLLAERGGWWVDADVVCLSDNIPQFTQFFCYQEEGIINGAVLHFARNDDVVLRCLEETLKFGTRVEWGQIGPQLISRVVAELGRAHHALPATVAYPVHYRAAFDLLRPAKEKELIGRIGQAKFLHLWNEMLRRELIDKWMLPPKGSLVRTIADRHQVEGWRGEYSAGLLEQWLAAQGQIKSLNHELTLRTTQLDGVRNELACRSAELATLYAQASKLLTSPTRLWKQLNYRLFFGRQCARRRADKLIAKAIHAPRVREG